MEVRLFPTVTFRISNIDLGSCWVAKTPSVLRYEAGVTTLTPVLIAMPLFGVVRNHVRFNRTKNHFKLRNRC